MSNALIVNDLMAGIITAINTAWSPVAIVADEEVRTIQSLPVAVCKWLDVHVGFTDYTATVTNTNQMYRFELILFFAMPDGTEANQVSKLKADYASAIIAQLQSGPNFLNLAVFPLVESISAKDRSPTYEGAAMIRVMFSCMAQASHH